jgi:hypothetical protein
MRVIAILTILFGTLVLTACGNVPGADGRYATHDRGNQTIDQSARRYFSQTGY